MTEVNAASPQERERPAGGPGRASCAGGGLDLLELALDRLVGAATGGGTGRLALGVALGGVVTARRRRLPFEPSRRLGRRRLVGRRRDAVERLGEGRRGRP